MAAPLGGAPMENGGRPPEGSRPDALELIRRRLALLMDGEDDAPDTHLRDYVRVIRKRLPLIVACFLAVVAATAVWTFLQRPVYRAVVTVLLEREPPKMLNTPVYMPLEWDSTEFFQTQIQVIRSRPVAQHVIDQLTLRTRKPELAAMKDPAGSLLSAVSVEQIKNTRLLEIRVEDSDPGLAADLANGFAAAYVNQNLDLRLGAARDMLTWLSTHVADLKTKVNESTLALERYKAESGLASSEERQSLAAKKVEEFNGIYVETRARRLELETTIRELRAKPEILESYPLVLNSPLIQRLKGNLVDLQVQKTRLLQTFREKHPEVIKIQAQIDETTQKVNEEKDRIVLSLESDLKVLRAREAAMLSAVEQYRDEAQALARKQVQSGILKRDADTNQELYEALLKRLKESDLNEGLDANRIRIVEPALAPTRPARPQVGRNLALAIVGGLGIALAAAFFVEYMDDTVRTPEQLERILNVPVYALIPDVSSRGHS